MTLPLDHFKIKATKRGVQRADVGTGRQQRERRSLTWELVEALEAYATK